ncbi:hypothetical protein GCM10028808_49970 [Spirosoma migulaei]
MATFEFIPAKAIEFKGSGSGSGWLVAVVALLVIGGLIWYFSSQQGKQTNTTNATAKT